MTANNVIFVLGEHDHHPATELIMNSILERKEPIDPRDPDYTRKGIFIYHNCWKCNNGEKPCVRGDGPCEYPHARDD